MKPPSSLIKLIISKKQSVKMCENTSEFKSSTLALPLILAQNKLMKNHHSSIGYLTIYALSITLIITLVTTLTPPAPLVNGKIETRAISGRRRQLDSIDSATNDGQILDRQRRNSNNYEIDNSQNAWWHKQIYAPVSQQARAQASTQTYARARALEHNNHSVKGHRAETKQLVVDESDNEIVNQHQQQLHKPKINLINKSHNHHTIGKNARRLPQGSVRDDDNTISSQSTKINRRRINGTRRRSNRNNNRRKITSSSTKTSSGKRPNYSTVNRDTNRFFNGTIIQNDNDGDKSVSRPKSNDGKKLVCYYGTWAVYRPDAGKFNVEDIDPFLCTHIIYGFTGLNYDNKIKPLDPWNDLADNYGKGAMKRFTGLKRINPNLKALVAIGGWNEGSIKYSKMASDPRSRSTFVNSVVEFLDQYDFDGLDLDWEYPSSRGGNSNDKQNFVSLIRELKQAFTPKNYLLSAAVSAGKWFIDPAYDIPQVSRYLDMINLMAYDYHGGWETKTGMNAPLFSSPIYDISKDDKLLNVNFSVNYWLDNGASRDKLILGVGSYGRSFTLDRANVNGINAPASQKGQAGPYTREPGSLGYNEICESFQRQPKSWTIVRDPYYLAPYAYNDRQWVSYDDIESLKLKAKFAKSQGLGGMMMWSIETDDFRGKCHNEKFPLLNTIKRTLSGGSNDQQPITTPRPQPTQRPTSTTPGHEIEEDDTTTTQRPRPRPPTSIPSTQRPISTSSTQRPTQSTSTTSTTKRPKPVSTTTENPSIDDDGETNTQIEFRCTSDGMFADPNDCTIFHRCVSDGRIIRDYRFSCAPGTAFNEQLQICDFKFNVTSCKNKIYRYIYY